MIPPRKPASLGIALLLATAMTVACDGNDEGDTGGGTDGSADHGADDGPGGAQTGNTDGGGDGNGDGAGDAAGCSMTNPAGDACTEGADCTVACLCADSVVNAGQCGNGRCVDPGTACPEACADFDAGTYSGSFCAPDNADDGNADDGNADDGNADDGSADGSGDDNAGVCVQTGEACEINGDCCGFDGGTTLCTTFDNVFTACADTCVFDSDCVSGCCVPLDGGGSVCGPADLC